MHKELTIVELLEKVEKDAKQENKYFSIDRLELAGVDVVEPKLKGEYKKELLHVLRGKNTLVLLVDPELINEIEVSIDLSEYPLQASA